MIFLDSFESLVESVYLGDRVTTKRGCGPVYVDPGEKNDYIVGKTIILTKEASTSTVGNLKANMNKVISRVFFPGTTYSPYLTRINFKVQWNGLEVPYVPGILGWIKDEELSQVRIVGDMVEYLSFPKVLDVPKSELYDTEGNITLLGWLLHQVGINVDKKTKYLDLDLIKTKKIIV